MYHRGVQIFTHIKVTLRAIHLIAYSCCITIRTVIVSFSVLLDGVWLSRNKRITYLLTYIIIQVREDCLKGLRSWNTHTSCIIRICTLNQRYARSKNRELNGSKNENKWLSYRKETALQGGVSLGQKWKTIFCRQYRSIFNHCDVIGRQRYRIRWNLAK